MTRVHLLVAIFALFGLVYCKSFDKKLEQEISDIIRKSQDATRAEEKAGLFEGDIEMEENMQRALTSKGLMARDAIISPIYRWTDGKVYYKFHKSLNPWVRGRILRAFRHIECHTCIRFKKYHDEPHRHHIVYFRGNGCYSRVGCSPSKYVQKISIGHGCTRLGTIVHESMHALGFFHEHTRQDRDKFVTIKWPEIIKKHSRNFKKYPRNLGSAFGKPYDYLSVMHYSRFAFARNSLPTIIPSNHHAIIGQRYGLSYYDAYQINKLYECKGSCKDFTNPFFCRAVKRTGHCHHKKYRRRCRRTCGIC